jgi:hypothetical protein
LTRGNDRTQRNQNPQNNFRHKYRKLAVRNYITAN